MGMQLPSELREALAWVGFNWPEADEEKLYELSETWMSYADKIRSQVSDADSAAALAWQGNQTEAIAAFEAAWRESDSPSERLMLAATGAEIIGMGLLVCAGVVLALKINVIAQLVLLAIQVAQAIATAVVTFGASLLEIPIFKMLAKFVVDQLLNMAIEQVISG
jgi:hypothetical protein